MVNRNNLIHGRSVDRHPLANVVELGRYAKHGTVIAGEAPQSGVIDTPEGQMTFQPGDFIVTDDPPTHAWPVRGDVFKDTYHIVDAIHPDDEPRSKPIRQEPRPRVSAPAGDVVEKKLTGRAEKQGRGIASSKTLAMDDAGKS
jgi:hypothetical protein